MLKGFNCALLAATLVCVSSASRVQATPAIKTETGRLQDLVARLASSDYVLGDPTVDSRPYVDPTPVLHAFRHLASIMAWGDMKVAAKQAAEVDYEIIEFVDEPSQSKYYVLREDLSRVPTSRGWGSYILNPAGQTEAIVEVPHPIADVQTPEVGGVVFERSKAKGYLLAGAHRLKADVPDLVNSIFHQVHTAWVGPTAQVAAWQIHGFASAKHSFPQGAHVIASTGDGVIAPEIEQLDAICEDQGLASYVFNNRPATSKANKRLNGDVPGVMFTSLAATANEQGRQSRSLGGSFVHVELETQVRLDAQHRERAATVIATAMSEATLRTAATRAQRPRGAASGENVMTLASFATEAAEAASKPELRVAAMPVTDEVMAAPAMPGGEPAPAAEDQGNVASDLVRSATPRPERIDGSRPRRARKRSS
jgi:hypothetical protein